MVVKENRGRKRYILFSHSGKSTKNEINQFADKKIRILGGKISCKVIEFNDKTGILRVDHHLLAKAREIMNNESGSIEIKTMKSSGTLKSLRKH